MSILTGTRRASDAEIVSEMDRRGRIIEGLEAQIERQEKALIEANRTLVAAFNRIHALPRTSDTELADRIERTRGLISSTLLRTPTPEAHPDDLAVDRFASTMKDKLAKKRAEGRGGWEDRGDCSNSLLSRLLRDHVEKGDPIDVGNLAMMLHQRGERITPTPEAPAGSGEEVIPAEWKLVPQAALDWLYGSGPGPNGMWFGDTNHGVKGKFWWRTVFRAMCDRPAPALASPQPTQDWKPIESAPKDRPILAYCNHEADTYLAPDRPHSLTLYAAHAEGMSHAPTGWHIVEWGGAFDDSTWEHPNQASLPDWWFVAGSEFEQAANPTHWTDLPSPPSDQTSGEVA